MERHSGTQAMEGAGGAAETGLEEPLWQLSLSGGGGPESYPERPNDADCIYYLRTGLCGYGARCRFNHPRDRSLYYMKTGMCKFGASCKYHHPRQGGGSTLVMMNIYGYPLRPGEKECSYYMKTGQCKFGVTCKFHHPQPTGAEMPAPTAAPGPLPTAAAVAAPSIYPAVQSPSAQSSQQFGVMAGNWSIARPALLHGSYMPGAYSPMLFPPGVVSVPGGWTPYPAPVSPAASPSTQSAAGAGQFYGLTPLSPSAPPYSGVYMYAGSAPGPSRVSQREHAFPERPGEPECQYYMKTGDCKYGSSCRYHHPPEWSASKANFVLSPIGLPLRPDAPVCLHYSQNGVCKFGPTCKFDHPMGTLSYSPSASSLSDMPVAPFPVGSSMGTLAPSSSSSDLRPNLTSGSNQEAFSTQISSMNTSSGAVGSIFSVTGPAPHPGLQQSGQSYSASGSSSMGHGGEVHTSS